VQELLAEALTLSELAIYVHLVSFYDTAFLLFMDMAGVLWSSPGFLENNLGSDQIRPGSLAIPRSW
jgi:hypothetical protein